MTYMHALVLHFSIPPSICRSINPVNTSIHGWTRRRSHCACARACVVHAATHTCACLCRRVRARKCTCVCIHACMHMLYCSHAYICTCTCIPCCAQELSRCSIAARRQCCCLTTDRKCTTSRGRDAAVSAVRGVAGETEGAVRWVSERVMSKVVEPGSCAGVVMGLARATRGRVRVCRLAPR